MDIHNEGSSPVLVVTTTRRRDTGGNDVEMVELIGIVVLAEECPGVCWDCQLVYDGRSCV